MLHRIEFSSSSPNPINIVPRGKLILSPSSSSSKSDEVRGAQPVAQLFSGGPAVVQQQQFTIVYRVEQGAVSIAESATKFKIVSFNEGTGAAGTFTGTLISGSFTHHVVTPVTTNAVVYYALVPIAAANHNSGDVVSSSATADSAVVQTTDASGESALMIREVLDAKREAQHSYYTKTRTQLLTTMDVKLGLMPDQLEERLALNVEEDSARFSDVFLPQVEAARDLLFYHVEAHEADSFRKLHEKRTKTVLVPWCTMKCTYCCMTRLEWTRHMETQYTILTDTLLVRVDKTTADLQAAEQLSFDALMLEKNNIRREDASRKQQIVSFKDEESATRAMVITMEEQSDGELYRRALELIRLHNAALEAAGLRDKNLSVMRAQDAVGQAERRAQRIQLIQCMEEERAARTHVKANEELRQREIFFAKEKSLSDIEAAVWKAEMSSVLEERDELAEFKNLRLAAEEAEKAALAHQIQAELELEYKELKKLKKAGPPKNPPIPSCPKCDQIPLKDMYTHRIGECPARPSQCTRCDKILPFSEMDAHRGVCPSRVVTCTSCGNHYKASYLESIHTGKCDSIQVAKRKLETPGLFQPQIPLLEVVPRPTDFVLPEDAQSSIIPTTPPSLGGGGLSAAAAIAPPAAAATTRGGVGAKKKTDGNSRPVSPDIAVKGKGGSVPGDTTPPSVTAIPLGSGLVVQLDTQSPHLKLSTVIRRALHPLEKTAVLRLLNGAPISGETELLDLVSQMRIGSTVEVALMMWPPLQDFNSTAGESNHMLNGRPESRETPGSSSTREVSAESGVFGGQPADLGDSSLLSNGSFNIINSNNSSQPKLVQGTLVVGTSVGLDAYQALELLVKSDEAQYCKPTPVGKGGKGTKKK